MKPVFDSLKALIRPLDTELLIITDGDSNLDKALEHKLNGTVFASIRFIKFGDIPSEGIANRRHRIAAIHNKARHYINDKCDYVLLIEDDTTYPPDTLTKMVETISYEDGAYVTGVELGRWNTPYVGAWKADNIHEPNEIISVMPSHGLQEIDAGGLYCCLVDAELYRMHQFEPLDKQGKNGLSCDVNFGLYLRQQGYKCLIDWSIQCDHIGDKGSVNLGNTKPEQVRFSKVNNEWIARRV